MGRVSADSEESTGRGSDRGEHRRRREQARTRVLRAALELAAEGPYRDLTVDRIARAAGISRSAFYTHFADKHELLLAALGEVSDELDRTAERMWRTRGAPALRVRLALRGVVSLYAEHLELLGIATEVSTYDEEVRAVWLGIATRFIDAAADHIRAEQRAGLIPKALRAEPIAEGLVWMAERCCSIYLRGGERTPEELVEGLAPAWTAALYPGVIPADELRPNELRSA